MYDIEVYTAFRLSWKFKNTDLGHMKRVQIKQTTESLECACSRGSLVPQALQGARSLVNHLRHAMLLVKIVDTD